MLMQNLASRNLQQEIRTSLTVILGMVNYLQNEQLSIRQQDYVNGILHSAKQLLNFINSLQPQFHNGIPLIPPNTLKVLLVEDHPLILQIHQSMLTELCCRTDVASNAKEALMFAEHDYDLIILDIGLPDLSGIELAKKLRNNVIHQKTRILALTAYTDVTTQQLCLEAGIEQVLHKPIDPNTLAAALHGFKPLEDKS